MGAQSRLSGRVESGSSVFFARAFAAADEVVIAPVFRSTLPEAERLSVPQLVRELTDRGQSAREATSIDDIISGIIHGYQPGDLVVLMSNGGFGGIHQKLLQALAPAAKASGAERRER